MRKHVRAALLVVALVVAVAGTPVASGTASTATATTVERPDRRPNIVLILTDDQTLTDMQWMPITRRLLGGNGVTFTDALSPHPLCCPARAEIVTGQYGQNNGVLHNDGKRGGYTGMIGKRDTLAAWLEESGYRTAQMGKYMNEYGAGDGRQAGWTHWNATIGAAYSYTRTLLFNDGNPKRPDAYLTDLIDRQTRRWVEEFSADRKPFFIWASHLAPHRRSGTNKALPARRHARVLGGERAPQVAARSFNVRRTVGKAGRPTFEDPHRGGLAPREAQAIFTSRIRSLQSVDEMVRGLVRKLRATGELDDTYIFFASDNGFLIGEHRLVGKNSLYREALAVPMLVRVPGATRATRSDVPVTITDLAPTIADIANVTPGRLQDGTSFLPLLRGRSMPWRDTQLVQTGTLRTGGAQPGWEWRGARTDRYTYGYSPRFDQRLLFDRAEDPSELQNLAENKRYAAVAAELHRRTRLLQDCRGASCNRSFGPVGDPLPRG